MKKMLTSSRKNIPWGLSLPKELIYLIDEERGDVSRSKYILRLLENNFQKYSTQKKLDLTKKYVPVDQGLESKDQQVTISH